MQLEIEQKFRLDDPTAVAERLVRLGVVLQPPETQIDMYFVHPARDFRQTDEAFRLRQIGDENLLTYKGPKLDATTKTRHELEVPLLGGAIRAQYIELLAALGFHQAGEVRKTRRGAEIVRDGHTLHIAWDEVVGLGTYLELEIVADESKLASAKAALFALAAELNLITSERRSYLELIAAIEAKNGE
jgi:adenylate cyclase class 2